MKNLEKLLAKNKNDNTLNKYLLNHTQMVVNLSMYIGYNLFNFEECKYKPRFLQYLALAAIGHDIGKITKDFQKKLNNGKVCFDEEEVEKPIKKEHVLHHIVSFSIMSGCEEINGDYWEPMLKAILYHHTPLNENITVTQDNINRDLFEGENNINDKNNVIKFYTYFKDYVNNIFGIDIPSFAFNSRHKIYLNNYKLYERLKSGTWDQKTEDEITSDMLFHIIRAIITFADRTVSAAEIDLQKVLDNDTEYMCQYLSKTNEISTGIPQINVDNCKIDINRFNQQMAIADDIINKKNVILKANAGYGKTMVGLLTVLKTGKKALWAVPKKMICDNTYMSIIETMKRIGINLNVCSFYGNAIQQSNNDSLKNVSDYDIVVIVIDSMLGRSIKNNLAKSLLDTYVNTMIFDEFHEFFIRESLFSAFLRLVFNRTKATDSISLFMSATPKSFINTLSPIYEGTHQINEINPDIIHGDVKINIHYLELNNLQELRYHIKENSFVIASTVRIAQDIYGICNETIKCSLIHSQYVAADLKRQKSIVYESHGQDATDEARNTVIIGTNIIGTGLDISAKNIYDFPLSPEETVQRLTGRGSRWGEYDTIDYYVCVCNANSVKKSEKSFIEGAYDARLNNEWVKFLKSLDGQTIPKKQFYELYEDFKNKHCNDIERYECSLFDLSSNALQNLGVRRGSVKKFDDDDKIFAADTFRGLSNDIWVCVGDNKLRLDLDRVIQKESSEDNKRRAAYYAGDERVNRNKLKYQYGLRNNNDYTVENCAMLARDKSLALPLFRATYDSEIGLRFDD